MILIKIGSTDNDGEAVMCCSALSQDRMGTQQMNKQKLAINVWISKRIHSTKNCPH